jgi:hypothetical protein
LSRGKSENYCKTSAPRKPTKQAPINKNKNVIFSPFILLYIIGKHKPNTLEIPEKYLTFFLIEIEYQQPCRAGPKSTFYSKTKKARLRKTKSPPAESSTGRPQRKEICSI